MATFQLSPKMEFLQQEYLLVQAWKKAHDYIRRHNWYSDVLELDLTNADLEGRLKSIADELAGGEPLLSNPLRLVLAPKSQSWEIKNNEWVPTKGPSSSAERLRPLAHLSVRDQIVGTAFMILLADAVETRQGDPRVSAVQGHKGKMVSGSTGQAPFSDRHARTIFHTHGNEQVSISFFEIDMNTYRNAHPPLKTPPAGWLPGNRH
jgi:hypothetical protein